MLLLASLLACGGLQLGDPVGQRCDAPCQVTLQHPLLQEGQHFATFTLQGGDLVTELTQGQSSVTVLHPKGRRAQEIAQAVLQGSQQPAMLAQDSWILVMDSQAVVQEFGVRPAGVSEFVLTP